MRRVLATLIASAALMGAGSAAAQTWTDWSEAEGRALVEAEGGTVEAVHHEENGDLTVDVVFDGWLVGNLLGFDCNGDGAEKRCNGLAFYAFYEIDDAARATEIANLLSYTYIADAVQDQDYGVQRDVELGGGGVPLANIRAQLNSFIATNELIAQRIFGDGEAAAAPAE